MKLLTRYLPRHNLRHAWLSEAFNTGIRDTILDYYSRHIPIEVASRDVATIQREEMLSRGTGGFDIKKCQQSSQMAITVIMKEQHSRQFARATMEVNSVRVTPHSVVRFEINPIATPVEFLEPDDPLITPRPPSRRPNGSGLSNELHRRCNPIMSSQRSAEGWLRRSVNIW